MLVKALEDFFTASAAHAQTRLQRSTAADKVVFALDVPSGGAPPPTPTFRNNANSKVTCRQQWQK